MSATHELWLRIRENFVYAAGEWRWRTFAKVVAILLALAVVYEIGHYNGTVAAQQQCMGTATRQVGDSGYFGFDACRSIDER